MVDIEKLREDLRKIRFRLVWDRAAELDAAREADKKGTPEMGLGDGWRDNAKETDRLIDTMDRVSSALLDELERKTKALEAVRDSLPLSFEKSRQNIEAALKGTLQ